MATFVTLINWTDQGIRNFKDTSKRAQAFTDLLESMGGKVNDIYWTLGSYDIVAVIEAPDDETATPRSGSCSRERALITECMPTPRRSVALPPTESTRANLFRT